MPCSLLQAISLTLLLLVKCSPSPVLSLVLSQLQTLFHPELLRFQVLLYYFSTMKEFKKKNYAKVRFLMWHGDRAWLANQEFFIFYCFEQSHNPFSIKISGNAYWLGLLNFCSPKDDLEISIVHENIRGKLNRSSVLLICIFQTFCLQLVWILTL